MKKIFILLTLCISTITIQAKIINVNDAMASAEIFLKQVLVQPEIINTSLELAYTETSAQDKSVNTIYVFNKSQNKGFVVVAADDAVQTPIIGYSDKGEFDYKQIPKNLKWLLSQYSDQIDHLRAQGKNYAYTQAEGQQDSIIIPPLLGDQLWNQEEPYNKFCPTDCPVGCVATAMTEVMYFHKWPLTGNGNKTYTDETCGQTFSVDFSKSKYDWTNILPRYTCKYTDLQANAIAKLSFEAGVSVEMMYSKDGSGSYTYLMTDALKNYFRYNNVKYKYNNISRTAWNNILKDELNNLRPICCSGVSGNGGHAFVCDGYTKNDYFHFNFGWNGVGNGYYLSSLDEQRAIDNDADFKKSQQIIYNINPDNKYLVGGIYYHQISSTEVEVCVPETEEKYSGSIIIPDTILIDSCKYAVTHIGCAAFGNSNDLTSLTLPASIKRIEGNSIFGCTHLDSLIVSWETPLEVFSTTFYTDLTARTMLVVPANAVSTYCAAEGWNQFYKVTDNKETSKEWTVWEPLQSGKCTYVDRTLFKRRYKNLNIYQRTLVNDSTQAQIKIDGTNIYSAMNMIVNWNKNTNACQVEKQIMGFYQTSTGMTYISDMPHYNNQYTYKNYPCKFNPDNGLFELHVIYFCNSGSFGYGTDTIKVDGLIKDYSLSLSPYEIQELADDSATQEINLTLGTDVAYVWYTTAKGGLNTTEKTNLMEKMLKGEISYNEIVPNSVKRIKLHYPVAGKYTTVFAVFSLDSTSRGINAYYTNYIPTKNWKVLGTAKYTDDYVSTAFPKVKQYEYEVTVEENTKHPGRYRIVNPYGKSYPQNSAGKYITDTVNVCLEINAELADSVYIPHNQAMNITLNAKTYGEMSVSSKAGKALAEGKTFQDIKADSICGTMKKGIITFPKNSLLEYFPIKSTEWLEANTHGTFKLDLSEYIKGFKGDANNDGSVDVTDITAIASYILGTTPETWNEDNADANSDGVIDVSDITTTATIILGN